MRRKFSPEIEQIAQRLQSGQSIGRGRKSPLFRWMFARADELKVLLDDVQPSWESFTDALTGDATNDGRGRRPSPDRTRKTWLEVRRAKGWLTTTTEVTASEPVASRPQDATAITAPPQKPRYEFKVATFRKSEPAKDKT
jgi:hypothetical protein